MMRRVGGPRGGARALVGPVAALLLLALLTAGAAQAAPALQSAAAGEAVFKSKCIACHTIGGGTLVGPDLKGVASQRSPEWLASWIADPPKLVAQGDPVAQELVKQYPIPMPSLGLTPAEVQSVVAYLQAQSPAAPAAPAPAAQPEGAAPAAAPAAPAPAAAPAAPAAALPPGDPVAGKEYFTGGRRLQNGGPPCMGCHSVAGLGALGGGALGPDLTPSFSKYGEPGLAAFLANPPTVTMNAVWARQPLTPEEQGSLRVFLQEAGVAQRPTEAVGQLAGLAVVVGLVLLALAQLYWRRRLPGVRRPMLRRMA